MAAWKTCPVALGSDRPVLESQLGQLIYFHAQITKTLSQILPMCLSSLITKDPEVPGVERLKNTINNPSSFHLSAQLIFSHYIQAQWPTEKTISFFEPNFFICKSLIIHMSFLELL